MKINNEVIEFPIVGKLSFFKVIEILKELKKSEDENLKTYAKTLLNEIESVPEFIDGTEDFSLIEKHRELIDKMMRFLFPPALSSNEIKGAAPPFDMNFFYTSERLKNIFDAAGKGTNMDIVDFNVDLMYQMGCATILQGHYQYEVNLSVPIIVELADKSGEIRYYRSAFNADLMEISPTENSKEVTYEDYLELMDNFHDIDLWKEKIPPNSWVVRGLGIVNLMDITIDQSINLMTSNLLEGSNDSFEKVLENIRSLLRIEELDIAFIRADHNTLFSVKKNKNWNIMMNGVEEISFKEGFCKGAKECMFENHEAFLLSTTAGYIQHADTLLARQLKEQKLKSYLITPLEYNGVLYGFLELASKKERALNGSIIEKLKLITPILSMAASRFSEENRNKIEAIIQEECTSIHPSVKWRFERAASEYLEAEESGQKAFFKDLVFPEVYPLYGQIDIRSSSALRNEAVKQDFSNQLLAVKKIIEAALSIDDLPVYDELIFRLEEFLEEFKGELVEGSEQRALGFLNTEVYPVFDHLRATHSSLRKKIDQYKESLNSETKMIYAKRKDFDESVNQLNALMAELIDEKQVHAQKMFPHYFERYKTDGLEFNSYIGQSITEKREFNLIYLNNLHLWQLRSICEIEQALYKQRESLPVRLEVASLILVHNTPLSIHFRIDEKRFDVEGAYNARYEIIKKRVDKAKIKGTEERVTGSGKIAIVYSSKQDANDYLKHIKYLEARGYLVKNSTEDVELQDLQGVTGLRALRVSINFEETKASEVNIDELVKNLNP